MKNQFFISVYDPSLHLKQVSHLASGAPPQFGKDASVGYWQGADPANLRTVGAHRDAIGPMRPLGKVTCAAVRPVIADFGCTCEIR